MVAQRFLQAFQNHGVQASQIPRLLPSIKLDNLKSEESLLAALTADILDQTASLFGIRIEWLEGVDDEIYDYLYCYKQPNLLLDHLEKVVGGEDVGLSFPLRVFATTKKLNFKDDSEQLLAPVIVEKIAELGDEDICRYHIYRDEFDWGYFPSRIELKAISRIVDTQLHTPVPLFVISEKEMRELLDGKLVPRQLFRGALITNPSLEDFALSQQESGVAKEIEELPEVLRYIDENQLKRFTFEKSSADQSDSLPASEHATSASVKENARKAAQAKHARINNIKARFTDYFIEAGSNHPSKKAAAESFFDALDEKQEQLLFDHKDAAIRTLLTALRSHLKKSE